MSFKQDPKKKFPNWPMHDEDEINSLISVVKSGKWWCGSPGMHQGENVWAFQEEFSRFQESKNCVAVSNGTVAIESALMALNIGMGDEVIVSDYTFVASASAVIATNAVPIFCDIEPKTFVMNVNKVEPLITKRTKAILPVHLGGNPVEMDKLLEIASKYDLYIIEDCAHAHGSRYKGKRVGNWGDAGTFSFQSSKVLTSGEGGAIICSNNELADKLYSYIDCGRVKNGYSYFHNNYGTNYRLGEFQASILRNQLKKFPKQHEIRNRNAEYFKNILNDIEGIQVMKLTSGTEECGYYIFPFLFEPKIFNDLTKSEFYRKLRSKEIPMDDCYPPLHSLKCFKDINLRKGIDYSNANWGGLKSENNFPVVSDIYSRSIQFSHEVLLTSRNNLDWIATNIESLK